MAGECLLESTRARVYTLHFSCAQVLPIAELKLLNQKLNKQAKKLVLVVAITIPAGNFTIIELI